MQIIYAQKKQTRKNSTAYEKCNLLLLCILNRIIFAILIPSHSKNLASSFFTTYLITDIFV